MQVLKFHSEGHFDVCLQTTDISSSWERFRGRIDNTNNGFQARKYARYTSSELCDLYLYDPDNPQKDEQKVEDTSQTEWNDLWPVVFETNKYQITICIKHIDADSKPRVKHVRREVEELFFADEDQRTENFKLIGCVDFLNEPGVFKLEFEYVYLGVIQDVVITFDVVSPKLDVKHDYISIIRAVNEEYENVAFRYLSLTYQQFKEGYINNDVVWLNIFEGLIDHYIRHIENIINMPHVKLDISRDYVRADCIKCWSVAMEEKYMEIKKGKRLEEYYFSYNEPIFTVDSVENRFVKYTLMSIGKRLQNILVNIVNNDISNQRGDQIAETRKDTLTKYADRLKKLYHHPFFTQVGRWNGMIQESLVLQSRQGYVQVYKDWIKLRRGIDLYNGAANIGTLQIWEIYELWCFIKMKHLICEVLHLPTSNMSSDYEQFVTESKYSILNLFINSTIENVVEFKYPDIEHAELSDVVDDNREVVIRQLEAHKGDVVSLHYQHTFNRKKQDDFNIHTATTEQRPDIVLNIKKADSQKIVLTYLYDAKYRVYSDPKLDKNFEKCDIEEQDEIKSGGLFGADYPPSDAINQMHRYRDAIYYGSPPNENTNKEVIGGYVLFPGRGDDDSVNSRYFTKSIRTVNIGAFPLTPNNDVTKEGMLLKRHLQDILMEKDLAYSHVRKSIPQRGLSYIENVVSSPVLLVGYATNENIDCIVHELSYYIPIVTTDKKTGILNSFSINLNYNKVKYLLLHTKDPEHRFLFEIKGTPKTIRGIDIANMGFITNSMPTDLFLIYHLKSAEQVYIDGFDINKVKFGNGAYFFIPKYRTIANPDSY